VLLVKFTSYIWFFYYTYTLLNKDQIPDIKPALVALGLLQALLLTRAVNKNQLLKELCRVLYIRFWAYQIKVQKVDCINL
jgi:hypothetical protein